MAGSGRTAADDVLALAIAAGLTVADAAKQAGLGERTVYRRLQEPAFQRQVCDIRAAMVAQVSGQLVEASVAAVTTLRGLLDAESESVRLGAAKAVLELGAKFRESTELEARIAALEEGQEQRAQRRSA